MVNNNIDFLNINTGKSVLCAYSVRVIPSEMQL